MEYTIVLAGSYEVRKRVVVFDVLKGDIYNCSVECEGLESVRPAEHYFDDLKTKSRDLKRFLCLVTNRKRANFTVGQWI